VFYGSSQQKFAPLAVYSGEPCVNRGETGRTGVDTPDSGWIQLKVCIQCVLFSVGFNLISLFSYANFLF